MAQYKKYITFKKFREGDYEITSKINVIHNSIDRSRKGDASIHAARVSIRRAHKNLFDILRANSWQYFVTLTFGIDGVGADQRCRDLFSKWSKLMRSQFPNMYYVAVPEYHKKGDLHYHIVLGGVTSDELGLVYSGRVLHKGKAWKEQDFASNGFVADPLTGEGAPIYNVTSWNLGFSTCTEIRSSDAVARYVSKYLTKCSIDPRFYNKRRFHASHNCCRPLTIRSSADSAPFYDLKDNSFFDSVSCVQVYGSPKMLYRKYALTDLSKEEIICLRLRGDLPMPSHSIK